MGGNDVFVDSGVAHAVARYGNCNVWEVNSVVSAYITTQTEDV